MKYSTLLLVFALALGAYAQDDGGAGGERWRRCWRRTPVVTLEVLSAVVMTVQEALGVVGGTDVLLDPTTTDTTSTTSSSTTKAATTTTSSTTSTTSKATTSTTSSASKSTTTTPTSTVSAPANSNAASYLTAHPEGCTGRRRCWSSRSLVVESPASGVLPLD
ncbi:hypothetical protein DFP72DRAFT_857329 [Ephemerocybe angulata]|uniref:Uncharacterized protein n=1 Tax=Ephemerocybe angulata TaxID=980116 RepID=A0A8H6LXW2_9AGAR|nr:hypothetical protein DFP72DRAFT_857329 [Tulosesus angulatus]